MQQVTLYLDPSEPSKIRQLAREVNIILDDPATGGGACKGHAFVLALHLLKHLKSFKKFTDLLTVQFDAVYRGITCLKQFCVELKVVCVCECVCVCVCVCVCLAITFVTYGGRDGSFLLLTLLACMAIYVVREFLAM